MSYVVDLLRVHQPLSLLVILFCFYFVYSYCVIAMRTLSRDYSVVVDVMSTVVDVPRKSRSGAKPDVTRLSKQLSTLEM